MRAAPAVIGVRPGAAGETGDTGDDGAPSGRTPSRPRFADLRTPVLGVVAWLAALAAAMLPAPGLLAVGASAGLATVLTGCRRRLRWEHVAWLVVGVAVAGGAWARIDAVRHGPVADLARRGAAVEMTARVSADPVLRHGRFSGYVLVRMTTRTVRLEGTGGGLATRAPVLVIAPPASRRLRLGEQVSLAGRLDPADGDDLAAVVLARRAPRVRAPPAWPLRAAQRVRDGVRTAAGPGVAGSLVAALVDGDDADVPDPVADDFRTAGLTHLLAVSGTNLTLVVGALLVLARWGGVRARGLLVVGVLGVVGFVLLARPEPSVLRAAAMGSVALLGLGAGGRDRGVRALGVALVALMLLDPALAVQAGFALSALATAGILFLAPGWRDRLCRWLPRWATPWAAEAIAVPTAAQLACTPVVAAISGQVSLVAVPANLLAAPVVGPMTVLGLLGGLLSTVWAPLGRPVGHVAALGGHWLMLVAARAADLPSAAVAWPAGPVSLLVLTGVCAGLAVGLGRVFSRRAPSATLCVGAVLALVVPLPTPGWPPDGWVLTACDVGQGDGLLLRVAPHAAVVVDTGTDPQFIDGCLRRFGIRSVPLVVLTHFHADHVGGLAGVVHGRRVGAIETTGFAEPEGGVASVRRVAAAAGIPLRVARLGEQVTVGPVSWRVLAPSGPPPADSISPPNDASIVMLVRTRGLRILMLGDEEPATQEQVAQVLGGRRVDVLKVAHHGSGKQDDDLVRALAPRLAVISVGVDNVYGHPAPSVLRLLRSVGATVGRTDEEGDVAVCVDDAGHLSVAHRLPSVRPPPGGAG